MTAVIVAADKRHARHSAEVDRRIPLCLTLRGRGTPGTRNPPGGDDCPGAILVALAWRAGGVRAWLGRGGDCGRAGIPGSARYWPQGCLRALACSLGDVGRGRACCGGRGG